MAGTESSARPSRWLVGKARNPKLQSPPAAFVILPKNSVRCSYGCKPVRKKLSMRLKRQPPILQHHVKPLSDLIVRWKPPLAQQVCSINAHAYCNGEQQQLNSNPDTYWQAPQTHPLGLPFPTNAMPEGCLHRTAIHAFRRVGQYLSWAYQQRSHAWLYSNICDSMASRPLSHRGSGVFGLHRRRAREGYIWEQSGTG